MDKHFTLAVKVGTVIWGPNGNTQTLTEVPKNALELWEAGTQTLILKKDGIDILKDFSKARLEKVLELRKPLNYKAESKLLEEAIKAAGKTKTADDKAV